MKKAMAFALAAVLALGAIGLVGCGSQGGGTQSQDGKPVLTVAMELAYPPFETKDDAGQPAAWPWTSCVTSRIATAMTS